MGKGRRPAQGGLPSQLPLGTIRVEHPGDLSQGGAHGPRAAVVLHQVLSVTGQGLSQGALIPVLNSDQEQGGLAETRDLVSEGGQPCSEVVAMRRLGEHQRCALHLQNRRAELRFTSLFQIPGRISWIW